MKPYLQTERATLYHGMAESVYPHIAGGSVSMVWSDGRYGMGKSEKGGWDDGGVDTLADWYAPHVEAWGRVCAPSATVYLWGTAEGWARLDPVMRAAGWTFRTLITWDKGMASLAGRIDTESLQAWPEVTEVCGMYQRIGGSESALRRWFVDESDRSGLTRSRLKDLVDIAGGAGEMIVRHTFYESQWLLPTIEQYTTLQAVLNTHGRPNGRPYLPRRYEEIAVPFTCPVGVSNVWPHAQVAGKERLKIEGEAHPCQKPLAFADRAIRASTRIGDTILDPFAGTNRIAVACRRLPEEERRHAIGIEMDQRWLDAVRPSLIADHAHTGHSRQPSLFRSTP